MAPPLVIVLDSDSEDEPVRGPKVRRIPSSIDAPSTAYTDSDHDNELGIRELARLRRGRQPSETVAQTSSEVIQEGPVLVTIDSDDDNIPETIDLTDFSDKTPEYRKQITQLHDTLKRSRASRVTNATKRTREAVGILQASRKRRREGGGYANPSEGDEGLGGECLRDLIILLQGQGNQIRNHYDVDEEEQKDPLQVSAEERAGLSLAIARLNLVQREGKYYVRGMATSLLLHQITGVDWMVNEIERSKEANKPRGGLLFDDMGLGKTVQCIATMCQNPPPTDRMAGAPHTTLIVCPLALLHQWKSEIEKHTEPGKFSVSIHYGKDKLTRKQLRKRDIVITTYQMVAQSYPNPNKVEPPKELPSSEREGYIAREFARARGNLHSVDYFRVIFDESHRIRNPETHTSCASMALALRARHRWCLTGTPIFNKLKDLYPAFNIIKMPGLGASAERFYYFLSRSSNQQKAMRLVLQYAMVRRSKIDSFLGKPLVELPPKVIRDILISFDPDTRALYDEIADKAREKLNKLSKESNSKSKKSALKTKKSIEFLWLMLLRLRQLCLHPYLLGDALEKWRDGQFTHCIGACDNYYSTEYGSQALEDSRKAELQPSSRIWKNKTRPVKEHVRRMRVNVRDEHIRRLQDIIHKEPAMQWGPKKDEEGMDVEAEEKALQNCPYCHKELELPVVLTACQHAFCEPCIKEAIQIATETNQIYPCDICRESVKEGDLVLLKDTRSIEVKKKKKNSDTRSIEKVSPSKEPDDPREIQKRLAKEFNENISDRFFLTPKLKAIKTQLVKWKTSRPGEKVVIFSNFNKSLDIIEKMVDEEGWSTARYDGGKTIVDRESALQKFATEPDCWIMLISIKAGGEGLNLTHASLVLTVDPWWNAAVEKQAFDRVHRIGQKKEVEVVRIIVEKSVEIRILEIQTRKLDISAEALGEGKYRDPKAQMAGMSQRQLMSLFGAVYTDSEGRLMVRRD